MIWLVAIVTAEHTRFDMGNLMFCLFWTQFIYKKISILFLQPNDDFLGEVDSDEDESDEDEDEQSGDEEVQLFYLFSLPTMRTKE